MATDFLETIFSGSAATAPRQTEAPPQAAVKASTEILNLETKLKTLELELAKEKEKALSAEVRFKEMQAAQQTVEATLEKLYQKVAQERQEQELRAIREKASGRVDALESRLDEFQKGLLEILKERSQLKEVVSGPQLDEKLARFKEDLLEIFRKELESGFQNLRREFFKKRSEKLELLKEEARTLANEIRHIQETLAKRSA